MSMSTDSHKPSLSAQELEAAGDFLRDKLEGGAAQQAGAIDAGNGDSGTRRHLEKVWDGIAGHASHPRLIQMRAHALSRYQATSNERGREWDFRSSWRRTMLAAASIAACAVLAWGGFTALNDRLPSFQTGIGSQHMVELADSSRIALDAVTYLTVDMSRNSRVVYLREGQAQFNVAKDPTRPFRVQAGGHAVVAIGTSFNVEFVDRALHVAVIEGRVAVTRLDEAAGAEDTAVLPLHLTELSAGQDLVIDAAGRMVVNEKADVDAAVAWRQGKVVLTHEPLGAAIARLNRYSRIQLEMDNADLARLEVTGVFEVGNTRAFANAAEAYFPVVADYSTAGKIVLRKK